jgi:hypothetical protein
MNHLGNISKAALCALLSLLMAATLLLFGAVGGLFAGSLKPTQPAFASTSKSSVKVITKVKGATTAGVWQFKKNSDGKNTITVVAYTGKAKHLKVPAKIKGKTVTRIDIAEGDVIEEKGEVIELPDRVTALNASALGTHLKSFIVEGANLKSVNLTKNTALKKYACDSILNTLNLTKNTALTYVDCDVRSATLDLSKNTALTHLQCGDFLTSLDLSANRALTYVDVSFNKLSSLKLPANNKISYLDCSHNQLTSLEPAQETNLKTLYCSYNQLTSLDLSKNTKLQALVCGNNRIADIASLAGRFGYNAVMPQDATVNYPLPVSKQDFVVSCGYTLASSVAVSNVTCVYSGKAQAATVTAVEKTPNLVFRPLAAESLTADNFLDLGTITVYYRENGSNTYTTTAPVKADRYGIYVKTSGSSTFSAQTSYLHLGTMTIKPHSVSALSIAPESGSLFLSWKDYSVDAANVSYYRVYYRKAGSSKWQYKTYKPNDPNGQLAPKGYAGPWYQYYSLGNLANKHKYYVKVRVYRAVAGSDVASSYSATKSAKTGA